MRGDEAGGEETDSGRDLTLNGIDLCTTTETVQTEGWRQNETDKRAGGRRECVGVATGVSRLILARDGLWPLGGGAKGSTSPLPAPWRGDITLTAWQLRPAACSSGGGHSPWPLAAVHCAQIPVRWEHLAFPLIESGKRAGPGWPAVFRVTLHNTSRFTRLPERAVHAAHDPYNCPLARS